MITPTQKQWQTVIDKLYSVLPLTFEPGARLDMQEYHVNNDHKCGTVHCVGGWYAVAHYQERAFDQAEYLSYAVGAYQMAIDLGFSSIYTLKCWANFHSILWGNNAGDGMFSESRAYDHGNGPAKSLEDIIHHFEFVKDKCAAYEK